MIEFPEDSEFNSVSAISLFTPLRSMEIAGSDADARRQQDQTFAPIVVTSRAPLAPNLGCADNNLAGVRRQCFYLALTPAALFAVVSVRFSHVFRECFVVPYWIFLQHGESHGAETI